MSDTLRAMGYRRTQKLWLSQENYDLVMYLAEKDKVVIDRILDRERLTKTYQRNED